MKNIKFVLTILFVGFLAVSLTACGGGGSSDGAGGGGNTPQGQDKLKDNVIIPEQNASISLNSVSNDTYTYSYSGAPPPIKTGDILLSGQGNGYLRKVISVQDQNGTLAVKTEQASLTDAFEELHLKETIILSSNIQLEKTGGIQMESIGAGGSLGAKINGVKITGSGDFDVSLDGNFDLTTPTFDIQIDIVGSTLKVFKFIMNSSATFNLDTTFKAMGSINVTPPEIRLIPQPISLFSKTFIVPIAGIPVPVIIIGAFDLTAGITFSAGVQAIATFGFNSTGSISAGVQNKENTWDFTPVASFNYMFSPYMKLDNASVVSAKAYVRPKFGLYIYDFAGPYIDLRPYGKGSFVNDSNPHYEAGIGITGNVGGELKIVSKVLATLNLELFDLFYNIWNYPYLDTYLPSIPSNLTAAASSDKQINLSWAASTDDIGVSGYKIYRNGTYLKSVSTTETSDSNLSSSTQYCYTVLAYDGAGNESAQSSQACATTQAPPVLPDTTPPNVPTNLAASGITSTSVTISWIASTDNVGVLGYRVYRSGTQVAIVTSGTSYQDTNLTPNTTYSYTVSAYDQAGNNSAQSAPVNATTLSGVAVGAINLPKTGQRTCYDESGNIINCQGTGQDGEFQTGVQWPDPRFTNLDGTTPINQGEVLDRLTGLVWMRDAGTPTIGSCAGIIGDFRKNSQKALDYVACLNSINHLGHNDWRLPNVNELESLVNATETNPPTWLNGQGFVNIQGYDYWSSTLSGDLGGPWVIWMLFGAVNINVFDANYVWPVRSGQLNNPNPQYPANVWKTGQTFSYYSGDDGDLQRGVSWPASRFTDHDDGTITDSLTGLMWAKNANLPNGTLTWQGSLDYVQALNSGTGLGGYHDWRLPNRKELFSLIDRSKYNPALPNDHPFQDVQSFSYWSSTTNAASQGLYAGYAWIVDMYSGWAEGLVDKRGFKRSVWPVRGGLK